MFRIYSFIETLRNDKRAVTALEYGLVAALVAGTLLATFTGLATKIGTAINGITL